jgi:hypothetical protein
MGCTIRNLKERILDSFALLVKRVYNNIKGLVANLLLVINNNMVFSNKEKTRFFNKTKRTTTGCLEWTSWIDPFGYGRFSLRGKTDKAHRVAWMLANGSIPEGKGWHGICVCHTCDNRKCVEISHLFLGTQMQNVTDSITKGRHFLPDWSGINNPQSKFNLNYK